MTKPESADGVLQAPGILWIEQRALGNTAAFSLETGSYTIHAYAETGQVSVNGTGFSMEPESGGAFAWRTAGPLEHSGGSLAIEASSGVAIVALSKNSAWQPEQAIQGLRAEPSAQPSSRAPRRVQAARGANTPFEMTPFETLEAWEAYAEELRLLLMTACGMYILPEWTPLNERIRGAIIREDYIVEQASFEVFPRFYAAGNLYRPKGDGPFPVVLCPHGHWGAGRFENTEDCSVASRCITMAKMGMMSFTYDMLGYNDSQHVSREWAHGSFPEAERRRQHLWGLHPFALQLYTSMRAIEFMTGLPHADPRRVAVTGASGGGTQTFALTAIDDRVDAAAPVNMISHKMQGGCPCENAPLIRMQASNMEIGALAAPRPMMLVSATGDWTSDTPDVEYPAIKGIYELYQAGGKIANRHVGARHNYNQPSREAVYRFFGEHVLEAPERFAGFEEPPYEMEPLHELRVFPGGPPAGALEEQQVFRAWIHDAEARAVRAMRDDIAAGRRLRGSWRKAQGACLGIPLIDRETPVPQQVRTVSVSGVELTHFTVAQPATGALVPCTRYTLAPEEMRPMAIIAASAGRASLADLETGGPGSFIRGLLEDGFNVMTLDPYGIGEQAPLLSGRQRPRSQYHDTFSPTDTAYRVQDIISVMRALGQGAKRGLSGPHVALIGLGEAGLWTLLARAMEPGEGMLFADLNGFAVSSDAEWEARHYIPAIRSTGGIYAALNLALPGPIRLAQAPADFDAELANLSRAANELPEVEVSREAAAFEAVRDYVRPAIEGSQISTSHLFMQE